LLCCKLFGSCAQSSNQEIPDPKVGSSSNVLLSKKIDKDKPQQRAGDVPK
jgi:hypothetical protein